MKLILMTVAISTALLSCGQDIPASKVPSVVINTIQLKFPNSSLVEWEKKKGAYEAEFKVDSTEHTVTVSEIGIILWYETKIDQSALPPQIVAEITQSQQGYTIDDIEKIMKDNAVYYRVELEAKGKKDKEMAYTSTGAIIENSALLKLLNTK